MIDIEQEQLLTLSEAAKRLPSRRAGRPPHVSTLYRWAKLGFNGTKLETCRVGQVRCTSKEALDRFLRRINDIEHTPLDPSAAVHRGGLDEALEALGW